MPAFVVGTWRDGTATYEARGADEHTRFHIGSLTKVLVGVAALHAVAADELVLDAPLARYLPEQPRIPVAERARVSDLLLHTSGITGKLVPHRVWPQHVLDEAARAEPAAVGTRHYSNTGFALLGMVLTAATGRDFRDVFLSDVARPIGLEDTGWGRCADVPGHGRKADADRWQRRHPVALRAYDAAGGACSTARDLLVLAQRVATARSSGDGTRTDEALAASVQLHEVNGKQVALPWAVFRGACGPVFAHSGQHPSGYTAVLAVSPRCRSARVVLANAATASLRNTLYAQAVKSAAAGANP